MENIMMLPASYCVMNEEEMTYTSGGANIVQAAAAVSSPFTDELQVFPEFVTTARLIRTTGPARVLML